MKKIKNQLVGIITLLTEAEQLQRRDVEEHDESVDESILALIGEALSLSHDAFKMAEDHEESDEEKAEGDEDLPELDDEVEDIEDEDDDDDEEDDDEVDAENSDVEPAIFRDGYSNPRGSWTSKDEREYKHIKASVLNQGGSNLEAQRIAAATVNRDRAERRSR